MGVVFLLYLVQMRGIVPGTILTLRARHKRSIRCLALNRLIVPGTLHLHHAH